MTKEMTEEEAKEYLFMKYNCVKDIVVSKSEDKNGFWFAFNNEMKFIFNVQIRDESYPEQFIYLLSKGFDLFNLIPEGLALDLTTIKI